MSDNISKQKQEIKQSTKPTQRERSRSQEKNKQTLGKKSPKQQEKQLEKQQEVELKEDDELKNKEQDLEDDMAYIKKIMGFSSFGSSKGKDHTGSAVEGVFKAQSERRKYRQYMHRRGGFNRLLDKID